MKKLYSLLCAVAVTALAANAAAPQLQRATAKAFELKVQTELATKVSTAAPAKAPAKAVATTVAEVCGQYIWKGTTALQGDTDPNYLVTITPDETAADANGVIITGLYGQFKAQATVDFTAKTMTIPVQNFGKNDEGYNMVACYSHWVSNNDPGVDITKPTVLTLGDDALMMDGDDNICLAAVTDDNKVAGYFFLSYDNTFVKYNEDAQWETIGTAKFNDTFVLPFFGEKPEELTVTLQQNKNDKNAYALLNPYKELVASFEASNVNYADDYNRRMVMHLEGGNWWFEDFLTGVLYTDSKTGTTGEIEAFSQFGSILAQYGWAVVTTVYPVSTNYYGVNASGVLTYPEFADYEMKDEAGNETTQKLANILIGCSGVVNGYGDGNDDGALKIVLTPLHEAGIEDVEAADADAPVEYFNLQGQRVAEPAAGLYIKRQGKTVSKVVIR